MCLKLRPWHTSVCVWMALAPVYLACNDPLGRLKGHHFSAGIKTLYLLRGFSRELLANYGHLVSAPWGWPPEVTHAQKVSDQVTSGNMSGAGAVCNPVLSGSDLDFLSVSLRQSVAYQASSIPGTTGERKRTRTLRLLLTVRSLNTGQHMCTVNCTCKCQQGRFMTFLIVCNGSLSHEWN